MRIAAPGIYTDFSESAYYADPCPEPSLTQSVAKVLLDHSPAHARLRHPRLNPERENDGADKYVGHLAIGSAAHRLLLGRGRDLAVLDYDDMRSKAARELYSKAIADDKLPVLRRHVATAEQMVDAARIQLEHSDYPDAFDGGSSEIMLAWQEGHVWCRQLLDWSPDMTQIFDYKTTGMNCAPHVVAERPSEMGWDVQAAFCDRGLDALEPFTAGRREYVFVSQENYPPYALSLVRISESDLTLGKKKVQMAIDLWGRCLSANKWPAYSLNTVLSRPRPWLETRTLERELAHEEEKKFATNMLMAG